MKNMPERVKMFKDASVSPHIIAFYFYGWSYKIK